MQLTRVRTHHARSHFVAMIGGDKQFLLLRFEKLLDWSRAKRTQFTLFLTFEAVLGTDMSGFYRSSYTNAQNKT